MKKRIEKGRATPRRQRRRHRSPGERPAAHGGHRARPHRRDTSQPVRQIFDDSPRDHWYTAAEARDYGVIDAKQKRAKPGRPITEQRPRPADPFLAAASFGLKPELPKQPAQALVSLSYG